MRAPLRRIVATRLEGYCYLVVETLDCGHEYGPNERQRFRGSSRRCLECAKQASAPVEAERESEAA